MLVSKVYVIILNWNGWKDTIQCIDSVFRNNYPHYQVIVCDNLSSDDSLYYIKQWAEKRSLLYVEYTRSEAERGGNLGEEPKLVLIQTGANLGFAGGNNVAIRYAMARNDFQYVWLLNNDTVIEADALSYLVERLDEKSRAGICGSTLLYYDTPNLVQALGGAVYNKWLGTTKSLGAFWQRNHSCDAETIEQKMDYVIGASMLVSKRFIKDIGLLSEKYFLYYEEIDWAVRAKGKYVLAYAPKSIVFHKEGASIGSSADPYKKSWMADFYGLRNKIYFTKQYYPYALPTVYFSLFISILRRIQRRQWDRAKMILKIIIDQLLLHK